MSKMTRVTGVDLTLVVACHPSCTYIKLVVENLTILSYENSTTFVNIYSTHLNLYNNIYVKYLDWYTGICVFMFVRIFVVKNSIESLKFKVFIFIKIYIFIFYYII